MVKKAQNCINIRSNCIIMQFYRDCYWVKSVTLSDGKRKYFQSKIRHWWIEDISNWNRKNLELHFDVCNFTLRKLQLCTMMGVTLYSESCNFASWWLQLCILMVAFLHGFLHWSVWKPNIQHFSFSYWMSYILPLRSLHSLRKSTAFLTRIHFILYWNALHSRKECNWFSYWT